MTTKQASAIVKLLEGIDIYISNETLIEEELDTFESLADFLNDNQYLDVEIIYYSNAMDYLHEHDNSLTESIGLAVQMGYSLENLNSEVLASLLASQNMRGDFEDLRSDIEEILS